VNKQTNPGYRQFPIFIFVAATFIWSWGLWAFLRIHPSIQPHSSVWSCLYVAALCGPLVGAVTASYLSSGELGLQRIKGRLSLPRCHWTAVFWAIFLPPLVWIVTAFVEKGAFSFAQPLWVLIVIWGKMLVRGGPLTEEIGWRGFLLPRLLSRMSLFWASAVIFPVWGLWHLPLWWLPGLPHHEWSFVLFLALLAPLTLLFSWFYVRGGRRVWLPILFHTSINFALHFSWVNPSHKTRGAFFVLLGIFWSVAAGVVLLKREMWFQRKALAGPSQVESREELFFKGYVS